MPTNVTLVYKKRVYNRKITEVMYFYRFMCLGVFVSLSVCAHNNSKSNG